MRNAQRLQLFLVHGTVVEVVERLQTLITCQTMLLAGLQRLCQPCSAVVAGTYRPHLAFGDQLAKGAHHIGQRHLRVVVMRLVEVDVVGLQALQ